MTLARSRILARMFASEPRVLRLCAPPGYGKSSLARLFARHFERHGVCDCAGIASVPEFAGRVLRALAAESQGGESISITRLRLHTTQADEASWSRALLSAWKAHSERALLVIEHAEALAEHTGALALLGDMLATRPAERVLLIASRTALPLRVAHYLAPDQILTLSNGELRLDDNEADSVFEGSGLPAKTIESIVQLADGWPIVLLLLGLFAQYDADVDALVDRLACVPRSNLHGHLTGELLSAFTPEMTAALLAIAAIPNASLDDVAAATGIHHATPLIDRLLHLPGFISADTGAYRVHPLVLDTLRARHQADLASYLLRAAREYERSSDFLRAAELYAMYGDAHAAAAALDRLESDAFGQPSARLIDVLTKIDVSIVGTHPTLWIAALVYRRQSVDSARLYAEGLRLQTAFPDMPASLARRLRLHLAMLAQELHKLAEARALLDDAGNDWADEPAQDRRLRLMTSAVVAAKQGRFAHADRFVDEADAVQGARRERFASKREQIAMEKARLFGDWPEALKLGEEALYAAQRSGIASRMATAARAVVTAAWYCNDDARMAAATELLESFADHDAVAMPTRLEHVARWRAALTTGDGGEARRLMEGAIEGSDATENAFLQIMMRVSAALLFPEQRRRLLEARTIAQPIESPPLLASLELLIDAPSPANYGIFTHLAARVARSPLKASKNLLHIEVLRGHVLRGTEVVHVADRGFELLVALAMLPAGIAKEELAATIWPSLDSEAALNTLKMCVSRTRSQLGDRGAIESTKRGYALGERIIVDVREIERLAYRSASASIAGEEPDRALNAAAPATYDLTYAAGWSWFAPYAAHLDELHWRLREQREVAVPVSP